MSQESSTRGYDLISDHFADFELMDANGDGFVTMLESDTYHFNKLNEGMPGATISACGAPSGYLLMTSDIDCNHKMSLGEFALRLMEPFEITLNKRNLDFIASHGPIYQEINKADFEKQYGIKETKKLFDQYDTNKDGKVSEDEIREVDKAMDEANNKPKGLSTGAIVGIVIGAVCLVGLIVGLVVYFSRKNKKEAQKDKNNKNKEKSNGNHLTTRKKTIGHSAQNNLNSVNKQKDKKQSAVR
ncbi:MAG: hypothetical protein IJ590_03485 [Rickettsiales bacterium]|nr:hypothetical protein [Rickettsiales bacterium]